MWSIITLNIGGSEFDHFRAHLKRVLFVQDDTGVRLPALPPKVWGIGRSQSPAVVEQRKQGITVFLNVMLALSELSVPVRTEFFDWIDWHPTEEVEVVEVGVEVEVEAEEKEKEKGKVKGKDEKKKKEEEKEADGKK